MTMKACVWMALAGCAMSAAPSEGDDDAADLIDTSIASAALTSGVNGSECAASPFNCKFHDGSSRVLTAGGDDSWGISPGASVRDGNGDVLAVETGTRLTFNFGQTRLLAGKAHALALTTSNGSAGWYPIERILGEASFRAHNGEVNAQDPGLGTMACYAVRNSHDATLELKKVVFDSMVGDAGHERAGDYLPLVRANGRRSVNLIFSVPGFGLGGATTDHFPAGTRFRRVTVPTTAGPPSIVIPLWVKDGAGRFRTQSGTMRFLYGYVRASDGVRRFGWMAEDALEVSTGCA
jgi:hypothetical protein